MTCRKCGAEIADKAIVCYRCGTPTADPVARVARPGRRSRMPVLIAIVVVVIALGVWLAMRTP